MNKTPLISVILPIYNVEEFLSTSIESVIHQTYENLEIILVDDGATDSSGKICDEYKEKDKRIKVIHKVNGGLSDARNAGIEVAKGEYLYFLDSDDFIAPKALEIALKRIIKDNSDFALFNFTYVDENNNKLPTRENKDIKSIWDVDDFWNFISDVSNKELSVASVVAWNKLYKASLFKNVRYQIGRINEDSFIITDIMRQVSKISYISEQLYSYRIRSGSIMSSRGVKGITDSPISLIKRCEYFIEYHYDHHLSGNLRTLIADKYEIKKVYKQLSESQKSDYLEICKKIKEYYKILKKKKLTKKDRISTFVSYRFPHLFILMRKLKHK